MPAEQEIQTFELRYLIHQSQAGAVIGSKGVRIKQMREIFDCNVRCFADSPPQSTERILRIAGAKQATIDCLKVCLHFLANSPPRGEFVEYDTQNYDGLNVNEYGGVIAGNDAPSGGQFDRNSRTPFARRNNQHPNVGAPPPTQFMPYLQFLG